MFKLVQPRPGELNSQIQLNFIGLSNEAREPAWGYGPDQSLQILNHYAFKCHLHEAVLMSVSILRVFLINTHMLSHHTGTVKVSKHS